MRDKIKGKLRSRQGMSLLLALLAFLICAVAGSVLLTAGTASSGTISERAKMDRRYFSVTSAAEFLREKFDGQSVSVTVKQNADGTWTNQIKDATDNPFVIDQSLYFLYLLSQSKDSDWVFQTDSDLQGNAKKWHTKYDIAVSSDDPDINAGLKATLQIIEPANIPRTLEFVVKSDDEKYGLKISYSASIVKEERTVGDGRAIDFRVTWKIGAISVAS